MRAPRSASTLRSAGRHGWRRHPSPSPLLSSLCLLLLTAGCRLDTPAPPPEPTAEATAFPPVAEPSPSPDTTLPAPEGASSSRLVPPSPGLLFPRIEQRRPVPTRPEASASTEPPAAPPTTDSGPAPALASDPAAAPAPPRPDCPGIAVRQGQDLAIDGQPIFLFGLNAPSLLEADFPEREIEPLLAELAARGVNTLRVWFFHQHDPERFERLLDAGSRQGIRFVVTMADDVHKGVDWFHGTEDEEKSSAHIERTVARFASRPEILLWEPVNEPNCGDGRYDDECLETIRAWLGYTAERIKAIDACRVVSTSYIGAGNYASELDHYRKLHGKDAIEILSVHKRSVDEAADELEAARDRDRPILYGEIYDESYDEGCQPLSGRSSTESRAERIKSDLRQALADGVDGYLLWELAIGRVELEQGGTKDFCSRFGFELEDPLWPKLQSSDPPLPPPVPWR